MPLWSPQTASGSSSDPTARAAAIAAQATADAAWNAAQDAGGRLSHLEGPLLIDGLPMTLPVLAVGNTEVAVTWRTAFPASRPPVTVVCTIDGTTAVLGKLSPVLKPASITNTGCRVTMVNTGLVSLTAGSGVLYTLAFRPN